MLFFNKIFCRIKYLRRFQNKIWIYSFKGIILFQSFFTIFFNRLVYKSISKNYNINILYFFPKKFFNSLIYSRWISWINYNIWFHPLNLLLKWRYIFLIILWKNINNFWRFIFLYLIKSNSAYFKSFQNFSVHVSFAVVDQNVSW